MRTSSQSSLFAQTQRVMLRLDEEGKGGSQENIRAAMIEGVAETYRLEGKEPNLEEIAEAVDKVLAEDREDVVAPLKKHWPWWVWVAGGVVAIPLLIPLTRIFIRVVEVLIRVFV